MDLSQERLDEFQGRMSNWVGGQGLIFQLTHGGSVRGAHSSIGVWLTRMVFRLVVLAAVAALFFWVYLMKRADLGWFQAELNERITLALGVDEATAGGIERTRGHLEISKMELVGGEESFFDQAHIRGLRTKMGLLDGVLVVWNGGAISIEELHLELRAGSESDDLGAKMFQGIFQESERFKFSRVEVDHATIRWGYSGVTSGSIDGAQIRSGRDGDGWHLIVTGGTFSQNWIKQLKIERMEIAIRPSGVEILEAKLAGGTGELKFTAKVEGPASSPSLTGSGTMRALPIDAYLPEDVQAFLGATLSGTFEVGGSPYASSGVTMNADITLEDGDQVELRDRLPLFKAISVVDRFRSYKNVRFTKGQFKLETGGEVAVITDISLQAKDLMRIEGEFLSRRPTKEEMDEALRLERGGAAVPTVKSEEEPEPEAGGEKPQELTLREAAKAAREEGTEESTLDSLLMNAIVQSKERKRFENEARARQERASVLVGLLKLGLNAKAFERAPELVELYPIAPEDGLRWLSLKLKGNIFQAGVSMAEEIYTLSGSEK